jgi:sulfate transport system permease protein
MSALPVKPTSPGQPANRASSALSAAIFLPRRVLISGPKYFLRFAVIVYVSVLVLVPLGWIIWQTLLPTPTYLTPTHQSFFQHLQSGISGAWSAATQPHAVHALELTLLLSLTAVAINTVFGVTTALMLVRHPFPGSSLLAAAIDLPLGLSPVVVGVSLVLVYGQTGWFGAWLSAHGMTVIFSFPGMVLATTFVTLPFVVREVVPVIREVGTDQEQAARTLGASSSQTFWRITLPSIRVGVVYGVVLTMARALGEFGAVSVVAGNVVGVTQTTTMWVSNEYDDFDRVGAYVASLELALLAIATLMILSLVRLRSRAKVEATTTPGG